MAAGPRRETHVATRGTRIALLAACLLTLGAILAAAPVSAVAAPLQSNPQVVPRSAQAGQVVTFSIDCKPPQPSSVRVRLTRSGTLVLVGLQLVSGTRTWGGQSTAIGVGTWTVTFEIPSTSETYPAGTLTITPAPTPTPKPTVTPAPPTPTPKPTTRPTPAPTPPAVTPRPTLPPPTATGVVTTEPSGSGSASPSASGSGAGGVIPGAPSGTPRPATSPADDRTGSLLLAILLGLFVIGGVAGIAILGARRRTDDDEPGPASAPAFAAAQAAPRRLLEPGPDPGVGVEGPRRRAAWEVYSALEDEPIGTVDALMPGPPAEHPAPPEPDADGETD